MRLLFNADRVAEDIDNNLQALSWSFTHFLLWRGYRLQFDCGEGAGMRLDDHIFRVDTLALSHGHYDHCAGLLGMLHVRNGLMGATDKPLRIVYPAEAAMMQHWISEAQRFVRGRQLDHVTFCPIEDGQSFELRKGHVLEARRVPHLPDEPCLAFRVGRQCTRRRPEYEHLTTQQVEALVRQGKRDQLVEPFFVCDVVYSGDTEYMDRDFCRKAGVLIHEASFLNAEDAELDRAGHHSLVRDALLCALEAEVKHLVLFHISRRYEDDELTAGIEKLIGSIGLACPVLVVRGSYNLPTD